MHGFIFTEIKKYAETAVGSGAWRQILDRAGLAGKEYLNGVDYPDSEAVLLVGAAAEATGQSAAEILQGFGHFLGGDLFAAFRPLIDPGWRTLDFLEHVEQTIHQVVRSRNRRAKPPELFCNRVADGELVIEYKSERQLCDLAKGIVRGVADHYGDEVQLTEETCMHHGDPSCRIWVAVAKKVRPAEERPRRSPAAAGESAGAASGVFRRGSLIPPKLG